MRSMKKVAKKLQQSLSILLSVAMIITCVPQTAFAAQNDVIDTETEAEDVDVVDAVDTTDVDAETEAGDIEGIIEEGGDEAEAAEDVDAVAEPEIETADVEAAEEGQDEENVGEAAVEAEVEEDEAEVSYATIGDNEVTGDADEGKYVFFVDSDEKTKDASTVAKNQDPPMTVGTSGYFTFVTSNDLTVEGNERNFTIGEDVVACTRRLKLGGDGISSGKHTRSIKFTASKKANVKVLACSAGGDGKPSSMHLLDEAGNEVDGTYIKLPGNTSIVSDWDVEAGTYYVAGLKPTANDGHEWTEDEVKNAQNANLFGIIVQEEKTVVEGEMPIDSITAVTYNGKEQKPTLTVTNDGTKTTLVEGTDYDLSYAEGVTALKDAGEYTVTVTGKGTYAGKTKSPKYTINKFNLKNATLTADIPTEGTPTVSVKYSDDADAENAGVVPTSEYDVTYTKIKDGTEIAAEDVASYNGTVKVIVAAKSDSTNFTGQISQSKRVGDPDKIEYTTTFNASYLTTGEEFTAANGNCDNILDSIFSVVPASHEDLTTDKDEINVDDANATCGTMKITHVLKLGGKSSPTNRAIKFTTEDKGTLTIYVVGSGSGRKLKLITDDEGAEAQIIKDPVASSASGGVDPITANVEAGKTYYLYAEEGGLNFYYLDLAYGDPNPLEVTATGKTYNGKPQAPTLTVKCNNIDLGASEYTVAYSKEDGTAIEATDVKDAGAYKVTVTGAADTDYADKEPVTKDFTIDKFTMSDDNSKITIGTLANDAFPVTVEALLDGEYVEVTSDNYDVTYAKEDGTAIDTFVDYEGKVIVTATAKADSKNFAGSVTGETELAAGGVQVGVFAIADIEDVVYNGTEQKAEVKVTLDGEDVAADDYTVEYKKAGATGDAANDITNVGTINVTVTGKEGKACEGKTATASYRINAYPLTETNVTVGDTISNGTVDVTVKGVNNAELTANDYEAVVVLKDKDGEVVTSIPADYVGKVTVDVTVTGKGNYAGEVKANAEIVISNVKETEYEVTFVVKGQSIVKTYEVGSLVDELPAEVTKVIGTDQFEGLYTDSTFLPKSKWNMSVNIVQADTTLYVRTNAKSGSIYVPAIPDQIYTGADIKPAVVVYAADGTLLTAKDYKIIYTKGATTNANVDPSGKQLKDDKGKDLPAASFVIEGKGNYTDKVTVTFNIRQVSIGSGDTFAQGFTAKVNDSLLANSKGVAPLTSLKYKKAMNIAATPKAPQDFTAVITKVGETKPLESKDKKGYPTVSEEGVYTLEVKGVNNFAGTVTKTIMVGTKDNSLSKAAIKLGKDIKKPDCNALKAGTLQIVADASKDNGFAVTMGKTPLEANKDFTWKVVYANGTTTTPVVGKAQLIITATVPKQGANQYYGSKSIAINVVGTAAKKAGLTVEKTSAFQASVDYTGKAIYQNNAVKVKTTDNKYLTPKKDYTISYKNNIKKGKATITFTMLPASGYTGKLTETFTINAAQVSTAKIFEDGKTDITTAKKLTAKVPYSKLAIKPSNKITLKLASGYVLKEGTDYTVSYKNNKNAGTDAIMTVKGKGSLTGSVDVKFDIEAADLSTVDIVVTSLAYKEGATKPYKMKLKATADGKPLAAKKDYTIAVDTCSGSDADTYMKAPDTAKRPSVTLTAGTNGNYKGTATAYFSFFKPENKLTAKNTDITVGTATYKSGAQVKPTVTVKFGQKTLINGKDYVLTWGKNNAAGKNKGSVTVVGQGIYGGTATKKFDIDALNINAAGSADDRFTSEVYDNYIDENILENERLARIAAEVKGIKSIEYNADTNTFTVTVDDATVNMYETFMDLFEANKNDSKIDAKYEILKTTFIEDLQRADKVTVTGKYSTASGIETNFPAKTRDVAPYLGLTADEVIDKAEARFDEGLERVAEELGVDVDTVKAYTLAKVVGKTANLSISMTYTTDKDDLELDYTVKFVAAN